jgi:hypothetical protein
MFIIALVQNQSEMSHYGYADARPLLEEFGYQSVLYTAQNIEELVPDLKRPRFDAILFASNALNDKTIRDTVMSEAFKNSFRQFLSTGKGCLILHQLRMAQDGLALKFLPEPLSSIQPKVRGQDEKASDGDLRLTSIAESQVSFLYPVSVRIPDVKKACLSFRSLKGLYWHHWQNVSETDWDILLYDMGPDGLQRPLILASKGFESFRIELCSLTIDWQRQKGLLRNILTYVVEGKHNTAILKDPQNTSAAFEYFAECLKSRKYPFRMYYMDQNLEDFEVNVRNGVHTIVILGPFVDEARIGKGIASLLWGYVENGRIKLISTTQDKRVKGFNIAGRERFALRLLRDLQLSIQQELYHGYIDGSFWSTVESLQILNDMVEYVKPVYDKETLNLVFKLTKTHDQSGSYDGVFGVTCALLWLRSAYLGVNDNDTQRTLKWVRDNLADYEDREKALVYHTLIDTEVATNDEKDALRNLLLGQQLKFEHLSEIDMIVYLRAAVLIGIKDMVVPIVGRLQQNQRDGKWIDLATTATAVVALLDALALLKKEDPNEYARTRPCLELMIFKAIIYLQDSMGVSSGIKNVTYPWDNKASTSLKCIHAWLKFEELIDLPIYELIDALKSYSMTENVRATSETALTILDELRKENRLLSEKTTQQAPKIRETQQLSTRNRILWIAVSLLLYFLISVIVGSSLVGWNTSISEMLKKSFVDAWGFHLGVASLAAAVLGVLLALRKRKRKVD